MREPVIQVDKLSKRFGPVVAVDGLSFRISRGSTTALLGGNGAGKTTTMAMLLGLVIPSAGRITVLGEDVLKHRYRVLPRMNFASPYLDLPRRLTVEENLHVYALMYGVRQPRARVSALAEALALGPLMKRPAGKLSAGQRTRVGLAKALVNEPELLLLDEPTVSLDPDTADFVRSFLERHRAASGVTMLLASHNMREVERLCDDVIMLRAGRLVDRGSPPGLLARYGRRTLEDVFLDVARAPAGETPARRASP